MSGISSFPKVVRGVIIESDFAASLSALRVLMLLEAYVLNLHFSSGRIAAKVEEQGYGFHVNTVHVGHLVDERLVCLYVVAVCKIEGVVVAFLDQFDGYALDVHSGGKGAAEVILLVCRRAHSGVERYLALPLVMSFFRHCDNIDELGVIGLESAVRKTHPVIGMCRVEAHGVGHAAPEVGGTGDVVVGTHFGFFRFIVAGKHGTVVNGVVLEDDAADGYVGSVLATAEVKHQTDTFSVDALDVGKVEDLLFAGLQRNVGIYEDSTVVTNLVELYLGSEVLGGVEKAGEVVVLVCSCDDRCGGNHEYLCLPAFRSSGRKVPAVLVTALCHLGICNLCPAGSVVVGNFKTSFCIGGFPKVGLGIVVEALEHHRAGLGGKDEVPCDGTVVVHKFQGFAADSEDLHLGCCPEVIVGDVREECVFRKYQEYVVTFYLKLISCGLL